MKKYKVKEYKVGEEVTVVVTQAKNSEYTFKKCVSCFFYDIYTTIGCKAIPCMPNERSDGKSVVFIKKGK